MTPSSVAAAAAAAASLVSNTAYGVANLIVPLR